jgi:hypothetical protein
VREALIEREVLLASAPHIIWPMRFVLPHSPEQRPAWLVRTGLFLYDFRGFRAGARTRLSGASQDTCPSLRAVVRDARKRAARSGPHLRRSWMPLRRKLLRVRGLVPSRNGVGHKRCRLSGPTDEAWLAFNAGSAVCVRGRYR